MKEYLARETLEMVIEQPLVLTGLSDKVDIHVNVKGGGKTGQAGAIRLGIARALCKFDDSLQPTLRP